MGFFNIYPFINIIINRGDIIRNIFLIIGGLALFLFGLNLMRESLSKVNNDKLKNVIQKATGSKFKALLTGILTTALIQSSSGVTAIVVAFMSADIIGFTQGVMIMIGANIGTTLTAFIFSLNIESYSLAIIAVAYLLNIFKSFKIKQIANALLGLGILFQGITFMNEAFVLIADSPLFFLITVIISKNSVLGFIGGAILSALIQSSSATIGLVQNLYYLDIISLRSAVPIMLGANAGTTIASLIVAIGATRIAKKAINVNILFNVIGGVIFLIFMNPFIDLLEYLESIPNIIANRKITIAYSHLIYNIISTIIFFFLYNYLFKKSYEKNLTPQNNYDKIFA